MAIRIAMFNHKGGVSKTTTTLHLAWMLARKGKRVLMVDADPQCNLTGLVLGYEGASEFENFYQTQATANFKAGLAPAFESQPVPLSAVARVKVPKRSGLELLPGHLALSEYEVTLGIAQELTGSIQTLKNLPGAISHLIDMTAAEMEADYVFVDMNPSLSSINQNILMTSDYFLIPCSPDFFSLLAIDSLASVIPKWWGWAERAHQLPVLRTAAYAFPTKVPRFLGTIISKYRPRDGRPTVDFQRWINQINGAVGAKLLPALTPGGMLVAQDKCDRVGLDLSRNLALIPDFNTLIAKSQKARTPVFALTKKQIKRGGVVLRKTIENRNAFKALFSELADRVIGLTS
ncbi:AAA family ATPase [Pendulispora rubella]|uniref:AAA family ATPase n=1 Tax=Pendulispora rubella TaxID=2741070 RepID=A0ABZ2KVF5_9BACT